MSCFISCGHCGKSSPFSESIIDELRRPLPDEVYQCPECGRRIKRERCTVPESRRHLLGTPVSSSGFRYIRLVVLRPGRGRPAARFAK